MEVRKDVEIDNIGITEIGVRLAQRVGDSPGADPGEEHRESLVRNISQAMFVGTSFHERTIEQLFEVLRVEAEDPTIYLEFEGLVFSDEHGHHAIICAPSTHISDASTKVVIDMTHGGGLAAGLEHLICFASDSLASAAAASSTSSVIFLVWFSSRARVAMLFVSDGVAVVPRLVVRELTLRKSVGW
jgi:hypothetical protein